MRRRGNRPQQVQEVARGSRQAIEPPMIPPPIIMTSVTSGARVVMNYHVSGCGTERSGGNTSRISPITDNKPNTNRSAGSPLPRCYLASGGSAHTAAAGPPIPRTLHHGNGNLNSSCLGCVACAGTTVPRGFSGNRRQAAKRLVPDGGIVANREDALDLRQDVFLKAYQNPQTG